MHLSIVIPAYNEDQRIGSTLATMVAYLMQQSYTAEIIVVDDGSTDGTGAIARPFPQVKTLQQHARAYLGLTAGEMRLSLTPDQALERVAERFLAPPRPVAVGAS